MSNSNMRDYKQAWVYDVGKQYRQDFYDRASNLGTNPLVDNPTVVELIDDISAHKPKSIIEIGCGFGRLLEPVAEYFNNKGIPVVGCDISRDMLSLCPEKLDVFEHDIYKPLTGTRFDVTYCRGVFMYFDAHQMWTAIRNLADITDKCILIYEWREVCEKMKAFGWKSCFEYHVIEEVKGE